MKTKTIKKEKIIKLKLNPPLWIEDWGGDAVTFEYKKGPEHIAKAAYCIKEIEIPLSEILRKMKKRVYDY